MKNQHMNPLDAVKTHLMQNSRQSIRIHFATFAEHPEQAANAHGKDVSGTTAQMKLNPDRFWIPAFSEGRVN